jgi:hypothetical protein
MTADALTIRERPSPRGDGAPFHVKAMTTPKVSNIQPPIGPRRPQNQQEVTHDDWGRISGRWITPSTSVLPIEVAASQQPSHATPRGRLPATAQAATLRLRPIASISSGVSPMNADDSVVIPPV